MTSRSRWSTALVSFFTGPFGGFLWIGAGRAAVASVIIVSAPLLLGSYIGFPVLPGLELDIQSIVGVTNIAVGILSVFLVVPFAKRFTPSRWYAHWASVLVLAYGLTSLTAFAMRSFLVQPFSIPTVSMIPTLLEGDHVFVSKSAYGYSRYSVPFGLLPIEGRVFGKPPERGDVVVFKDPIGGDFDYVKRIVGIPDEAIEMREGVLHINGEPVRLSDAGEVSMVRGDRPATLQRETLPNGASYVVVNLSDNGIADDGGPWVVPAGSYFVMGDNRDNSRDSRTGLGFIPYENLIGRAERLFWNSAGVAYAERQNVRPSFNAP